MKRITIIAMAAFAAMALAAPGSALAGGAHLLGMYKVEKHIDVEGDGGTYSVSCPNNDIAVDGMWRVDNADQDNDYVYDPAPSGLANLDVLNSLEPVGAYADPADVSKFTFEFVATEGGDVQGKLFLTCLPNTVTALGGHAVAWLPSALHTVTPAAFPAPSGSPNTYTVAYPAPTASCGNNTIAIQPGFQWLGSGTAYGKPFARVPTSPTGNNWNSWQWGFFTPTGGTVTLSWRCLPKLSDYSGNIPSPGSNTGHRHRIVATPRNAVTPTSALLKAQQVTEIQVICGEHYKAMLGAWDFGYSGYSWNLADYYAKLWYLGMDPRPKARAFKIMNTDTSDVGANGKFHALCFKDKTT